MYDYLPQNITAFTLAQSFSISFIENQAPIPFEGRSNMATAKVGTKVYFFGGLMAGYEGTNNSYSYDTLTDSWTKLPDYSRPIYGACATTDGNDTIWVFGNVTLLPKIDRANFNFVKTLQLLYFYTIIIIRLLQVATIPTSSYLLLGGRILSQITHGALEIIRATRTNAPHFGFLRLNKFWLFTDTQIQPGSTTP